MVATAVEIDSQSAVIMNRVGGNLYAALRRADGNSCQFDRGDMVGGHERVQRVMRQKVRRHDDARVRQDRSDPVRGQTYGVALDHGVVHIAVGRGDVHSHAKDLARIMVDANGAKAGDEIGADRRAARVADLDPAGTDLLRVARHAVGGGPDVVALDQGAIRVNDVDLGATGEAFLGIAAISRNHISFGYGCSADSGIPGEYVVAGGPFHPDSDEQGVADYDGAIDRTKNIQAGESVAFSRRSAADDVAGGRGSADVAADTDGRVDRAVDLATDEAVVVADEFNRVAALINVAEPFDDAIGAVDENGGRTQPVRLKAVDADFGTVGIGVADVGGLGREIDRGGGINERKRAFLELE